MVTVAFQSYLDSFGLKRLQDLVLDISDFKLIIENFLVALLKLGLKTSLFTRMGLTLSSTILRLSLSSSSLALSAVADITLGLEPDLPLLG